MRDQRSDADAKNRLRQRAMFLAGPGDKMILRDYPGPDAKAPSPMPHCAARNAPVCMKNLADSGCVRFMRVRLCQPGGEGMAALKIDLPWFTTVLPLEALGATQSTP
ncbi:hypothetical protein [Massilia horti]|uniref:Uncharacterized protein n=1 Tax=Massilia horti TaxID=2562153 RepID=A0A4Y9SW30_9BURK|nr:hypothetical protein [Massilia horti]TFW29727.1 hypothetical protein E4O92_18060 [Massilia horti]